ETTTGISVVSRGRGQQIRGQLKGAERPSYITFDDVEDEESVKTAEQRKKARGWMYKAVIPALPRRSERAMIVGLGTLLGRESLLASMWKDPRFNIIIFGVHDLQGELLWPE